MHFGKFCSSNHSEGVGLCIYEAWSARPASGHHESNLRLNLLDKRVQAFLRLNMVCYSLPCVTGRIATIS